MRSVKPLTVEKPAPFIDFSELKRSLPIAAVLNQKGLLPRFRQRGHQLFGPCPVHQGDNPTAFVVCLEKNLWYCFTRCRAGGDVIELVMRLDGVGHYQAACALKRLSLAGADTPSAQTIGAKSFTKPAPRSFKPFTATLPLTFHTPFLIHKHITPSTAAFFEAGAYLNRGLMENCLAVRLHDHAGNPMGYAGRRLDPTQARNRGKWVFPNAFPKGKILYNIHRLPPEDRNRLVVTECPWSVMRLFQLGIPAVALLGLHLTDCQLNLLKTSSQIVLMLDGDPSGRQATETIKDRLKRHVRVEWVYLPPDKDPDDLDDQSLLSLLENPVTAI